ncbi:unnamed protein product [Owenia fusiformis]|uniref:GPN-loop GTPase 3 n=1 Tax=Owenia fusiformis TaxID=6347 RepID=A0A8J1UTK1_OWEFU|nr:unnamed protein product [Owenia fusiformis]
MPKYAQIVMGPAGSGKSTYCSNIVRHCEALKRRVFVINLDPAAEVFDYPVLADIRELVSVEDVMEDESLRFGPNGGLVFCMEYLSSNFDWLEEQLDNVLEDDYVLFDCPGQIELYTHIPVMRQLVERLETSWNFRLCGVFLMDSQFLIEGAKFVSGILTALAAMVNLEIPHVNIMSKLDLLSKQSRKELDRYLEPDLQDILDTDMPSGSTAFQKLNSALATMINDYSLVKFVGLDPTDEESLNEALMQIDNAMQYGEDLEPKDTLEELEPEEIQNDYGL